MRGIRSAATWPETLPELVERIDRLARTTLLSLVRGTDPAGSDARGSTDPHLDRGRII